MLQPDYARMPHRSGILALIIYIVAAATACAPRSECHGVLSLPAIDTRHAGGLQACRVLMIPPNPGCPVTGGERNMDFFARGLHAMEYDVHVFVQPGPLARRYDTLNIPTSVPRTLYIARSDADAFVAMSQEATALTDNALQCSAAGSCTAEQAIAPLVSLMEQLDAMTAPEPLLPSDLPTFVPADTLDIPGPIMRALRLRHAALGTGADVVFADRGRDAVAAVVGLAGTSSRILWYPQMTASDPSDAFLAQQTRVVTCGEGVRTERFAKDAAVAAVPNGVDTQRFSPLQPSDARPALFAELDDDALVVGSVATVERRKNQRLLVQAVADRGAALRNVHLYFFGRTGDDGSYQKSLVDQALQAGIADRVHFVGNRSDIATLLPHFDVFVLPSFTEGMPLSLLEAMSAGVASLASDIPGNQEMAGAGVAYFSPHDASTLGNQLVTLADDSPLRARMGVAGRATVLERGYTSEAMLRNMAEQVTRTAAARL